MFFGAYYIWIMLGFFLMAASAILLISGILWIGHRMEKRRTGAKHGFLELPDDLKPRPEPPPETPPETPNEKTPPPHLPPA